MTSIVTLFSVTVPLIAPAGALFFAAKLVADKYVCHAPPPCFSRNILRMYDILVLCPPDKEMEAGLSYGKVVPVVAVTSLIFFNAAMCAQFILLKVDGPAAVAGICLALSMLGCVVWAARTAPHP